MRQALNLFYGHFVWATWDRLPLLTGEVREAAYAAIRAKCEELHCSVYALNGTENHVHLVVKLAATISQADLVGQVKGAASHLITHKVAPDAFFKWQGGYGAFSFSHGALAKIVEYVENQEERHRKGDTYSIVELP